MADFDYDLIVIGAGPGGMSAATTAGSLGARVLLIDKEKTLGGECLRYGCIPSKTLIKAAAVHHLTRNLGKFGLKSVDVERPDFSAIRSRIEAVVGSIQNDTTPTSLKRDFNIEVACAAPSFVDSHTIAFDNTKVTAKNFILATGTRPQVPDIEGLSKIKFLTNREIYRIEGLPASMIILGGGPHALETAQSFARLGAKITLIDFRHRFLTNEDGDISDIITSVLSREGVAIHMNSKATQVVSTSLGVRVVVQDSLTHKTLEVEAEKLFVATGRRPNVEGLELEKAGVSYEFDHIEVDRYLRTSVPHIFAVGDVNGEFPFAHAAIYQGGIAANNAVKPVAQKADYSLIPRNIYLDPEIASVGYNEQRAHAEGFKFDVQVEPYRSNERALAEGEVEGFIKIILRGDKPIGVQIVGANAGDLIAEWLHVLAGSVSLADLGKSVHAYPTRGALSQMAGEKISFPKMAGNPVMKWLGTR